LLLHPRAFRIGELSIEIIKQLVRTHVCARA
jgi:hypothetical protein